MRRNSASRCLSTMIIGGEGGVILLFWRGKGGEPGSFGFSTSLGGSSWAAYCFGGLLTSVSGCRRAGGGMRYPEGADIS